MFFTSISMVSQFIFKSFIHFELILVYGCMVYVGDHFNPAPFIEETIFTPLYACAPFVKYELTIETWVYFWAHYSIPLIYVFVLMPVSDCLDYSGFVVQFDIRYVNPSNFVLLS